MINKQVWKDLVWGVIFVLIQVVLIRHLRVFNTNPDIIWVFVLWLATTRDRLYTVLMTAGLAFFQDALLDVWGLNMFAKVAVVFLVYPFLPKEAENRLLSLQVFTILLITSVLHNLILIGMGNLFELYNTNSLILYVVAGNSLYTAAIGSFIYLFSSNPSNV